MASSKHLRRLLTLMVCLGLLLFLGAVVCNVAMVFQAEPKIYRVASAVPERAVALVLGTSPTVDGRKNLFFEGRMDTAARLWKDGKVRHFLVSGDHGTPQYNEVAAMQEALVARGVPASAITGDHAGFRTLDSLVRARQVFKVERLTVVTDDWHLPRALFLAKSAGVDAIGVSFESVPWGQSGKTRLREWLSRVKAAADVYVLGTDPKFLGEPVPLPVASAP